MNNTYLEETNPSDDEIELDGAGEVGGAGSGDVMAPPPYSDLSSHFGSLEESAESCGLSQAAYHLRKAMVLFIEAHAAKPARQTDIRAMLVKHDRYTRH